MSCVPKMASPLSLRVSASAIILFFFFFFFFSTAGVADATRPHLMTPALLSLRVVAALPSAAGRYMMPLMEDAMFQHTMMQEEEATSLICPALCRECVHEQVSAAACKASHPLHAGGVRGRW